MGKLSDLYKVTQLVSGTAGFMGRQPDSRVHADRHLLRCPSKKKLSRDVKNELLSLG